MRIHVDRTIFVFGLVAAMIVQFTGRIAADETHEAEQRFRPSRAIIVELTVDGALQLVTLNAGQPLPAETPAGLLVWKPEVGGERWTILGRGNSWPDSSVNPAESQLLANVRGGDLRGVGGLPAAGALLATIQLEPLDGSTIIRGSGFVTPQDGGQILSYRPTIRRSAEKGSLPARVAVLTRGNSDEVVLRIPFIEGQTRLDLSIWKDWPAELPDGLPPGRYSLRFDKGLERNQFTVIDPEQASPQRVPIDSMFALLGSRTDPMAVQYAIEHLLSFRTEDDKPAFLGDALDLVESLSEPLPAPLKKHRDGLRDWLENLATDPGYQQGHVATLPVGSDTGIESIDAARKLIAAGQWSEALQALDQVPVSANETDESSDKRRRGLRVLYRATILAEAGTGSKAEAISEYSGSGQIFWRC